MTYDDTCTTQIFMSPDPYKVYQILERYGPSPIVCLISFTTCIGIE